MGFEEDLLIEQDLPGAERLIRSAIIPVLAKVGATSLAQVAGERRNYDFTVTVGSDRFPIEAKRDTYNNDRIVVELFGSLDLEEGERQRKRTIETWSMERDDWNRRIWQFQGRQWFDMLRGKPGLILDENLPENHLFLFRKAGDGKGAWYLFDTRKLVTFLRARYKEYPYYIADNSKAKRPYYTLGVLIEAEQLETVPELKEALICKDVDSLALLPVAQLARVPFQCDED